MRLTDVRLTSEALLPDCVRLQARVSYERPSWDEEIFWFEVPSRLQAELTPTGNPWLLCLLPLAMALGERLQIALPLDPLLFRQAEEIMRLWACWHPPLRPVPLEADRFLAASPRVDGKLASFFTGGVDAFFTALQQDESVRRRALPGERVIDDFLYVVGLDVLLHSPDSYRRRIEVLQQVATELGKGLVVMATNVRASRLSTLDYGAVWHGCALGASALLLERRYSQVLLSSSHDYRNAFPWGSHMTLDPLMSTGATRFVHYGAGFTRFQKTRLIAEHEVALRHLHVCWRGESPVNCSRCQKCFRTLLALDLLGKLPQARSFAQSHYSLERAARIHLTDTSETSFIDELLLAAQEASRPDMVRALTDCLAWNKRMRLPYRCLVTLGRVPGLKRLSISWQKKLLRGAVR